jgi:exopolysaccharide production protein ExoQ
MTPVVLSPFANQLIKVLIFPVSILVPHGVVWEIIIGGLIGLYYSRKQILEELPYPLVVTLFLIPLWAIVTTLWAKYPIVSLIMSLKILVLVLLGIFWCRLCLSLPQSTRQSLIRALLGGLFLGLFFLLIEYWSGQAWRYYLNKPSAKAYAQGSLLISLVVWPAILWALRLPYTFLWRFSLSGFLLIIVFWTLFQIDCDTSYIGLFMGLCAFVGTLLFPRLSSWGMRLFVPLFIVAFPFISLYAFKPEYVPAYNSYIHSSAYLDRLYIWNEVATSSLEHPIGGIGMDGTHSHDKASLFRDWTYVDESGKKWENHTPLIAMHPHNAILQLWLELGLPGVILGTLLAYLSLFYIYRTGLSSLEKAVSAGLFTGTFLVVWVNLGFWQNWWISGLWIIIGLTISMFNGKKEANEGIYSQLTESK